MFCNKKVVMKRIIRYLCGVKYLKTMKHLLPLAALATLTIMNACKPTPVDYTVEIAPFKGDKACAISFTYDDGMLCQYTDVAPELEKRGFRGTFWIIGQNMDKNDPGYEWMTWDQVRDLSKRGHEISNHSWTHPSLPSLTPEQLEEEIVHNDSVIESVTGLRPKTFCYPYNAMSPEVVARCSEGRVGTRTFQAAHGQKESHCTAESLNAWLIDLIAKREWGVTMTHGTTYGWDMWDDPQVLYAFYDEVKAHEDSVWVGTFAQVAAYREEQQKVQAAAVGDTEHCVVTLSTDLDPQLYDEPLTLKISGNDWGKHLPKATQNGAECCVSCSNGLLLIDVNPQGGEVVIERKRKV